MKHTMPTSGEMFAEHMKRLRVRRTDKIVLYDHLGFFSVCRGAYMLRYFGATDVRVMNGGMKKWLAEGRSTYEGKYTDGEGLEAEGDYDYKIVDSSQLVSSVHDMHDIANDIVNKKTDMQVVDARAAPRFEGGKIAGSLNMPFMNLVNPDGTMKGDEELAQLLQNSGADLSKPIVNTCGSGVTACIVDTAMRILGAEKTAIYDGSWSEYSGTPEPNFTDGSYKSKK
jgi:thiosulfate/3-mercaptopyruvate sulfurtransferase